MGDEHAETPHPQYRQVYTAGNRAEFLDIQPASAPPADRNLKFTIRVQSRGE